MSCQVRVLLLWLFKYEILTFENVPNGYATRTRQVHFYYHLRLPRDYVHFCIFPSFTLLPCNSSLIPSLPPLSLLPLAVRKIPVDGSTGGSVDLMSVATGGSNAPKIGSVRTVAAAGGPYGVPGMKSLFMQVSLVFLLISGYYAMVSEYVYAFVFFGFPFSNGPMILSPKISTHAR